MGVKSSGHHVPSVRKSEGRPFQLKRSDKSRPTLFPKGSNTEHDHWRLHNAERSHVEPRQGDYHGTVDLIQNWLKENELYKKDEE